MQLHQIQPKVKFEKKKRIGRGGKKGTYSGRGVKGQKARAGRKIRPAIRDIIKQIPKLRGASLRKFPKKEIEIINLFKIEKKFNENEKVDLDSLYKKNLIKNKNSFVKILSVGELSKKLIFSDKLLFSKKAREKILKSGSKIEKTKE